MKLTVVTYGSDGDTRPFAALSRGLLDAGHDVQLFAERSSLGIAQKLRVPCTALAGDVRSMMPAACPEVPLTAREVMAAGRNLLRLISDNTENWMQTIAEHARDADAVLFSGLAMFAGLGVAKELQKPHLGLWLLPISPTREFCSPTMPPLSLPGLLNRLTYRALHATMWRYYGRPANAARLRLFGGSVRERMTLDCPILYGISPQLVERPTDWPANHQLCGHWSPPAEDWHPSPELEDFLAAGPPPMYVGFGSPSSFASRQRLEKIVTAISGRRALFYPGWSDIDATMLPKNFCVIGETSHSWLLSRCCLAIHHGGAGTTHTSARAGIPSVVLPFGADQFFWASRLTAAGVAPKYLARSRVTVEALRAAIEFTQTDAVRQRAQELSAAMAREDGVTDAVRHIATLLGDTPRMPIPVRQQGSSPKRGVHVGANV